MTTRPSPSTSLIQRHPILVGVAAGVAFVGFVGLAIILWCFWWIVPSRTHANRTAAAIAQPDTTPPTILRVQPRVNPVSLTITFSEPVSAESAEEALSYAIAGANPVMAKLDDAGTNAVLILLAPLAFGSTAPLILSNIQDLAGNVMPLTEVQVKAPVLTHGFLRADYFTNITWQTVAHLTSNRKFPDGYDHTVYRTSSTSPRDFGDNYGLRLWGFFIPPTNGNYTFYVRSDDESEVFLSSDSDPANEALVASQTGSNRAYDDANGSPRFSAASGLRAGQMYFFEALLKDGGGQDYLTVVYKAESEPAPVHNTPSVTPIPSSSLACYADAQDVSVELTEQPTSTNILDGQRATLTVVAKVIPDELASTVLHQWQRSDRLGAYTNIPGATARRFSTPPLSLEDNGARFRCVVTVPGATITSDSATVNVLSAPPQIETGATGGGILAIVPTQPNWPQFRGPNGQGVSETANPPIHFNALSNRTWRTAVPPGHSSPCVCGQRVFLVTFRAGKLETHAYDRLTGKQLWQQPAPAARIEKVRPFNSPASSTPAANADHVFAYFGSYGVLCYDHEGKELWRKPLATPKNQYGTASSPILFRDTVVLVLDSDDRNSKLVALRAKDGEVDWQTERPQFTANWSTPAVWDRDGQQELVVLGSRRLTAYDADSGQERWWVDGFSPETIGVPVFGEGLLFVSAANRTGGPTDKYQGIRWEQLLALDTNTDKKIQKAEVPGDYTWVLRPEVSGDNPGYADPNSTLQSRFNSIDADKDGTLTEAEWEAFASQWGARFTPSLKTIRPGGSGDLTASHIAWQLRRGIPEIPSPLHYRGRLYLVRDGGFVQCVRPGNGEVVYEDRVGVSGSFCASPVAAGGRIYLASHSGTVAVLDGTSDRLQVLARNVLGEKIWATPALVENTIYIRTESHLYAFSTPQ